MFIVRGKAINVQYIFFMVSDSFCLCQHACSAFFKKKKKKPCQVTLLYKKLLL